MSTIMGYNASISEPFDLFNLVNNLTGGNYFTAIIVVIWFMTFAVFSRVLGLRSLPISFFVSLVLGMFFYWLQLTSIIVVGVSFGGLIITSFISFIVGGSGNDY